MFGSYFSQKTNIKTKIKTTHHLDIYSTSDTTEHTTTNSPSVAHPSLYISALDPSVKAVLKGNREKKIEAGVVAKRIFENLNEKAREVNKM